MRKPWYMDTSKQCKVMNRIAEFHRESSLEDLRSVLDTATQMLWQKVERFYNRRPQWVGPQSQGEVMEERGRDKETIKLGSNVRRTI